MAARVSIELWRVCHGRAKGLDECEYDCSLQDRQGKVHVLLKKVDLSPDQYFWLLLLYFHADSTTFRCSRMKRLVALTVIVL